MNSLYREQLLQYAKRTNDALREMLGYESNCLQMVVVDAMRHSLLDAGKRIRAALTLEFARLCGVRMEDAMPFACAVEMIHAYSLIHDDLPCMDNDDFRRGKPSCHKRFGEANALLAGDALLTLAFETLIHANVSDAQKVQAVQTLAKASGVLGMVGGQVIDLLSEGTRPDFAALNTLYVLKTGALFQASARLGCIAGNAGAAMQNAAQEFAKAYGLAFQITDDILDVTGDERILGKPVGSDRENEKTTYVTLLGIDRARAAAQEQVAYAKQKIAAIPDNAFLLWIADMVLTRDH
jgi:geranylgeranyl diphosphate synthase type II